MKNRDYNLGATLRTHFFRKMPLRRWNILFILGIFLWMGMFGVSYSHAATIHVDCQTGTPDGSNGFYKTISAAVAAAAANDIIRVYTGTCWESGEINIAKNGLRILGDNPSNTIVTHLPSAGLVNVFTVSASDVEIAGLTISGHWNGIEIKTGGNGAKFHHNHLQLNGESGISANINNISFIAFNNVINRNNGYGIFGDTYSHGSGVVVKNNIVFKNVTGGIFYAGSGSYNSSYDNMSVGSAWSSNYFFVVGAGSINNISGNISQNCLFVDEAASPPDYRLQVISPCRNTGSPADLDVDGSISDMGSFGGPGAALFWPYGNGGPVITDLTIDPMIVPRGGTLSINATGEIR